jgi:pSer/pThr/pTyr-binding forkhead associated (FHA) protein
MNVEKQRLQAKGSLHLRIVRDGQDDGPSLTLEAPGVEGYIIGRSDLDSGYVPDVDMSTQGGQQQGVSRRHAVLVRYDDIVNVIDLGSLNGTAINGERLTPHQPYPLHQGDRIRIANLDILILGS